MTFIASLQKVFDSFFLLKGLIRIDVILNSVSCEKIGYKTLIIAVDSSWYPLLFEEIISTRIRNNGK